MTVRNCGNCNYFDFDLEHRVDNYRTMSRCLKDYRGGVISTGYCADWLPAKRKKNWRIEGWDISIMPGRG